MAWTNVKIRVTFPEGQWVESNIYWYHINYLSVCISFTPQLNNIMYFPSMFCFISYIYPSVILLFADDIFVSLHISSTVYLRLWIIYNVPRTQNILLCFYPNKHLYVLQINRLWLQFVRWITVLSVTKIVLQQDKTLYCSCCCKYIHRNCSGLLNAQYEYVKSDTSWYCKKCIGEMFPFNHIDDESIFLKAISEISTSSDIIIRHHTDSKIFNPFEINEDDSNILEY